MLLHLKSLKPELSISIIYTDTGPAPDMTVWREWQGRNIHFLVSSAESAECTTPGPDIPHVLVTEVRVVTSHWSPLLRVVTPSQSSVSPGMANISAHLRTV